MKSLTHRQPKELQALPLKERATALINTLIKKETRDVYERGLTIRGIIDNSIPISILKEEVGKKIVSQALDAALTSLVANLNLKWNVTDVQVKGIVEDLLHEHPHESLEDFLLIFRNARLGRYGELMRLDSAIVFTWVDTYLDEKYEALEAKLYEEKDHQPIYNAIPKLPTEVNDLIRQNEAIKVLDDQIKVNVDKLLNDYKKAIKAIDVKAPAPLTRKQIAEEGGEHPKARPYRGETREEMVERQLFLLYSRAKQKALGGLKTDWLTMDEWIEKQDPEEIKKEIKKLWR
jgi:hypothetical protein